MVSEPSPGMTEVMTGARGVASQRTAFRLVFPPLSGTSCQMTVMLPPVSATGRARRASAVGMVMTGRNLPSAVSRAVRRIAAAPVSSSQTNVVLPTPSIATLGRNAAVSSSVRMAGPLHTPAAVDRDASTVKSDRIHTAVMLPAGSIATSGRPASAAGGDSSVPMAQAPVVTENRAAAICPIPPLMRCQTAVALPAPSETTRTESTEVAEVAVSASMNPQLSLAAVYRTASTKAIGAEIVPAVLPHTTVALPAGSTAT